MSVPLAEGEVRWSVQTSLPLAPCDLALFVAAIACWWPRWLLAVELTYFWGLAGTLQAVITPDLSASFPQLEFFEFVIGHLAVVIAALFLVVGLRLRPRPGSVLRVFAITAAYTVFVGWFDWVTGSNYMFLAAVPSDLRVRGTGEALVRVSAPVDEHQQVTIAHLRHPPVQFRDVRRVVDEGPTKLPSVHGAPPRWRASSRLEGFPRSFEVRNHRVRSRCVMGTFDPYPSPVSCRGSASGFHLSKASLAFSPACLRLLLA